MHLASTLPFAYYIARAGLIRSNYCGLTMLSYKLNANSSIIGMGVFMPWDAPKGQGLVEYALIILLVGLAVIIALTIFGAGVGNMFSQVVAGI